ncbi:MAG: hypothetical protein ACRDJ4_15495 [Actinomycetota bacterium]
MDEEFIRRRTADVVLLDGTRVIVQPIVPEAKELLATSFERLSPRSRYRRFFSPIRELSEDQLRRLTEIDYVDHFAWTARTPGGLGVGVSRYVRLAEDAGTAEVAVTVIHEYQDRGLGTFSSRRLPRLRSATGSAGSSATSSRRTVPPLSSWGEPAGRRGSRPPGCCWWRSTSSG